MTRVLLYLITVGLLVAAAVWFAENPGDVAIRWQGWYVETTVSILLIAILAALVAMSLLFRAFEWLFSLPRRFARSRKESRKRKGYLALIDGLSAVAAGDADQAYRNAKRADSLLRDPPLTMLLSAQAAQLSGDGDQAKSHFAAMLERPETAFLGLRGLLTQAVREGDHAAALDYARRAHALNPDAPWLAATLFDLQARAGLWREAQDTLQHAVKRNVFSGEEGRRKKAVVLWQRARQAEDGGSRKDAVKFLRQAVESDPGFVAANVWLSRIQAADGKQRRAAGLLEDAWRFNPHPELAQAYMALYEKEEPLQRVRRAETLAAVNPGHLESHLVVGEAALAAELWGQARNHLLAAAERRPSSKVYRLLAEVEERETGNSEAARRWLALAAESAGEPSWQCRQCATPAAAWESACPSCHGVDTLSWTTPVAPMATPRLTPDEADTAVKVEKTEPPPSGQVAAQ